MSKSIKIATIATSALVFALVMYKVTSSNDAKPSYTVQNLRLATTSLDLKKYIFFSIKKSMSAYFNWLFLKSSGLNT